MYVPTGHMTLPVGLHPYATVVSPGVVVGRCFGCCSYADVTRMHASTSLAFRPGCHRLKVTQRRACKVEMVSGPDPHTDPIVPLPRRPCGVWPRSSQGAQAPHVARLLNYLMRLCVIIRAHAHDVLHHHHHHGVCRRDGVK